ncbi:MAG: MliC family protein [Woeseiaceae bacterium]|nr:MliC family protein [Woeseiaceae bacterium]
MKAVLKSITIGALLFGAACADESQTPTAESDPSPTVTAVFDCGVGETTFAFTTRTVPDGLAVWLPLEFERPYLALRQTPAASGSRYAGDGVVVWQNGEEAMLEVDGERFSGCRHDRQASIWEHAKLSGVDFRATGNEPGWVLEISERTRIDLSYDYGASRIQAVSSEPVSDQQAMRTTWAATANGQALKIEISAVACTDSMSGDRFDSTVTIYLGDRELKGCGRPLH